MKARVHVLALISSTHQNFAGDQQIYLATLLNKEGGEPVVLMDHFRSAADPIRPRLLREQVNFSMRLTRQEDCDRSAALVFSMLDSQDVYDEPGLQDLEERAPALLPCFLVDHEQTRVQR